MTASQDQPHKRLLRYHGQSIRLLQDAMDQIRQGRWLRCEDLLWGSLTLAVKGVALSRGEEVDGQEAVREYAERIGNETRDRRIREAFTKLSGFSDTAERVRESRMRADHLVTALEDVTGAVERLWDMLPMAAAPSGFDNFDNLEDEDEWGELEDMDGDPPPRRRR